MRIPKVFIALTILAMLLTAVIVVTSPIAVIPSMMSGFAPYGTTTIGAVPDLVVVLSALAFVGASMTFAQIVSSSTTVATYRSQRSLSRGNLGQLFNGYLRAILLQVTATLSSFFQPTIYGYIPPVLYAPFGAGKNSAAAGSEGTSLAAGRHGPGRQSIRRWDVKGMLVTLAVISLVVIGYVIVTNLPSNLPTVAAMPSNVVTDAGSTIEEVAVPEFSGLAIVAFSALAASLYLLRRKRR